MTNILSGKTVHIPYNNDILLPDLVNKLNLLSHNITPIFYFAPNPELCQSGRRLPHFEKFIENNEFSSASFDKHIMTFLKKCKEYGFSSNLLLNNVLLGMPFSNSDLKYEIPKIQMFLEKLDSLKLVNLITISNPYLLELLDLNKLNNIKIKTSVNFQIKNSKSIEILNTLTKNFFSSNISEIELQKDLLHDIPNLQKIKSSLNSNIKLSIIINEGCINGCPYQQAHQIHSSCFPIQKLQNYNTNFNFSVARCKFITAIEPWRFLDANWILPEQLHHYINLIDSFKITDRSSSSERIINTLRAYIFNDYDRNNINALISLMKMEKWEFPKSVLDDDFDKILFEDVNNIYFKNIFQKIIEHNKAKNIPVTIKLKGFCKNKLFKYEEEQ